jgi:iron(III) transport system permease protein
VSGLAVAEIALTHHGGPPMAQPVTTRGARRAGLSQLLVVLFVAAIGFLVLYPLVMLLLGSFAPPRGAPADVQFSLEGYQTALADTAARSAIVTTIWLSLVRASLAVLVAVFLAWAITRTNVPGRRVFHYLMLVSFFMPLLPQLLAWSLLLSPRTGTINVWLRSVLAIDSTSGPFNIYSYEGIIFMGVLAWSGFLYLFIAPAFEAVDASLEEAARMAGANTFRTLLRVSVPLLLPAVLGAFGLAFVRMVESFETELFLGTPAQIYVFTTQIYSYISEDLTPRYPPAIALSTLFIILTLGVIGLQWKLLGNRSYVTVTGKSYQRSPADLGAWKYALFVALLLFNVVHLALPLGMLVLGSLQRSVVRLRFDGFTLNNWSILANVELWDALKNTLVVGCAAATVTLLMVSLSSYIVVRTKFRVRGLLDVLTWAPYMVPSFVLGVGFLWAVLRGIPLPFVLYGTLAVLIIAFVVRLLPLGARLMNGTMVQLSPELEEAARMSGATWTSTFVKVVVPLLTPALAMGWLMFMVTAVRDLSTVILLYGPGSRLLSVVFFAQWRSGTLEGAAVIGLLMTLIGLAVASGIVALQRLNRSAAHTLW